MDTRARHGATRRDSPILCLIYAALFAVLPLAQPIGARLDMAKESDVQPVAGSVQDAPKITRGKNERFLNIFVLGTDGLHHLKILDDVDLSASGIMKLQAGDNVTARVKHSLGPNLDWLWELRQDGNTILSYEQTRRHVERQIAREAEIAHWSGILSIVLFVAALLLRRHFGAWRSARAQPVPAP